MVTALGVQFVDAWGDRLPPWGSALELLHRIDLCELDPRLCHTRIRMACDVTAPLLGPAGQAPSWTQKGRCARRRRTIGIGNDATGISDFVKTRACRAGPCGRRSRRRAEVRLARVSESRISTWSSGRRRNT
jgi:hypothetical protein